MDSFAVERCSLCLVLPAGKLSPLASPFLASPGRVRLARWLRSLIASLSRSGCSTFLKTVAGEIDGFIVEGDINYEGKSGLPLSFSAMRRPLIARSITGISRKQMHTDFRGEAIYTAEVCLYLNAPLFARANRLSAIRSTSTSLSSPSETPSPSPQGCVTPHSVQHLLETDSDALQARAPRHTPGGLSKNEYAEHIRDVTMAILGISHTVNTKVGNDFIRGVSGGERKRVTIAEASLSGAPLQCWDNSTRGLDSANAIEFCRSLKLSTSLGGKTACVSLYQAPQSAYDVSQSDLPA